MSHYYLGHVFVSHTAVDKPFVRQLTEQLRAKGFQVWLDERDLLVGDPLAERISQALATARVVLVVVSKASVASKWLRYELNVATDRMIKGECRVIPVVIDDTPLPPEVRGLLYAECRASLDDGIPAIVTALQYESRRATMERGFWAMADKLIAEVFGGTSSVSMSGEYFSRDYNAVSLPIPDDDGNEEVDVFYDTIPDYRLSSEGTPRPLTEEWWDDFIRSTEEISLDFSLVFTERPVAFRLDATHRESSRVGLRRLRYEEMDLTYRQVVVADVSGVGDEGGQVAALKLAREMLLECAEFLFEERRRRRTKVANETTT